MHDATMHLRSLKQTRNRMLVIVLLSTLLPLAVLVYLASYTVAGSAVDSPFWPYRAVPLLMLTAYLLSIVGVLQLIRRKLAPLADLQQAARHIEQGDYTRRLNVSSGDEFELLSRAFNSMSQHLAGSFEALQSLSDMDRTILTATRPDEVVARALAYCSKIDLDVAVVLMGESQSGRVKLCRWHRNRNRMVFELLSHYRPPGAGGRGSFDEFVSWLRDTAGIAFDQALMLKDDAGPAGAVLIRNDGRERSRAATPNIFDVADRLTLALTHLSRAHDLYRQAHFDALTGLMNRHAFRDRLNLAVAQAQRDGKLCAVLFLDLDRFKQVNDTQGHGAGDRLLTTVAARIASSLRGGDSLARLGSDEFAVIAPGIHSNADMFTLCERLITVVNTPVVLDGLEHLVGASIGISVYPRDGSSEEQLVVNAEAAMHRVKSQGGSAFAFFDTAMNELVLHRVRIESRLRRAILADELSVVFQPVYDLALDRVTGAEALLRWTDGELGVVEPSQFIPIAEDTGLIRDVMPILIRQSADVVAALRRQHTSPFRIALNVSPKDLLAGGFASQLLDQITRHGVRPDTFTIEITESVFIDDVEAVTQQLDELRHRGVLVALDDFGTGYSSLNLLRRLPIDIIKIDRAFIAEITRTDQDRRLARQIILIADIFNRAVVAEGVTSAEEVALLRQFGCQFVQGFGISRPLPPDELCRFVAGAPRQREVPLQLLTRRG
jgi:diguanylate cyclase